jgi:hypothetical protein
VSANDPTTQTYSIGPWWKTLSAHLSSSSYLNDVGGSRAGQFCHFAAVGSGFEALPVEKDAATKNTNFSFERKKNVKISSRLQIMTFFEAAN